jgi:hypothetical protein
MKMVKKITSGILLMIIGVMHTQFALSAEAFGRQFKEFAGTGFFKICNGANEAPFVPGHKIYETMAAFWFFYFGIFLIILGLLVHSLERNRRTLPHSFTVGYLVFVLIGSYMIPASGMTYFMLPHAVYMLISNYVKARRAAKVAGSVAKEKA